MKNYQSIAKITFTSPIGIDDGYKNHYQGEHQSTMELFVLANGDYQIEWIVESLDLVEHIGIYVIGKSVHDYDGVFELPVEAVKLLNDNGFDTTKVEPT